MPRGPLFREEDKFSQRPHLNQDIPGPNLSPNLDPNIAEKEVTKKGGQHDALWNRMNAAMRLSCQQVRPQKKR